MIGYPEILLALLAGILGSAAGFCVLMYLVTAPLQMSRWAACSAASALLALLTAGLAHEGWEFFLRVALALLGFAVGYGLGWGTFFRQPTQDRLPSLRRVKSDPGLGGTAVIYLSHGEARTYDGAISAWLAFMREMDASATPFVPFWLRPFFLTGIRRKYLHIGGSQHTLIHRRIFDQLAMTEQAARGNRSMHFYLSFLDSDPRPTAAAIEALNDGTSRIVVLNVFLTESSHTEEGLRLVAESGAEDLGVPVVATEPLWNSDALQQLFLQKAERARGELPREQVGILLVGHGQPVEWEKRYPKQTVQETAFRQGVIEKLVKAGYPREQIALGWMEFLSPTPAQALGDLLSASVRRVLVFSASISAEAVHSEFDVPRRVADAHIPAGVEIVHLGAWNEDPLLVQALREKLAQVEPL